MVSYRPLIAAAALVMALTGGITLAAFSGGETRPAYAINVWTVEVNEEGFNPRHCNIVRGDRVFFKNTGDIAIRVYRPGHGGLPDDPDWTLQPNETTASAQQFDFGGEITYKSSLGHEVTVFSPNTSTGTPGCQKEAPTPTPTPTFTATPTATQKPPGPKNCTWIGCAVSLGLAADGE
jgi:hypothetical protein